MFDNIGKNLDEEANKRSAISLFVTIAGLGASIAFVFAATVVTAVQVAQNTNLDEQLVELIEEQIADPLPPPPPPPPPAAAAPDEDQEDVEPEPDELSDEIQELKDQVDDQIKSDVKPAGVVGGVEGGVQGGVIGGRLGGTPGGTGVKVFHHSELQVKKRVPPDYPEAAKSLNLGDQKCLVTVRIDEEGVPYDATVAGCAKVFHDAAREGILKWRWYPAKDGKSKVKAQTTIAVIYKLT